jgi:hypothetical protein
MREESRMYRVRIILCDNPRLSLSAAIKAAIEHLYLAHSCLPAAVLVPAYRAEAAQEATRELGLKKTPVRGSETAWPGEVRLLYVNGKGDTGDG